MNETLPIVLHIITSLDEGGAEATLFRLCEASHAYAHVVVSMKDEGKYGGLLKKIGIKVVCLRMPSGRLTLTGLALLWKTIKINDPSVVQTWMYHADLIGGLVSRLAGVRSVVWGLRHSNLTPGTVRRTTLWIARVCALLSHCIPTFVASCSSQALKIHVEFGYASNKFRVIPNGYDLKALSPDISVKARLRDMLDIPTGLFVLGMVARYDQQKDHCNLFKALSILKSANFDFICLLVGYGMSEENDALDKLLNKYNISDCVRLLGRRNDIPEIMNMLDVHVLSSLGEAFPNVLAEAMACGTPCVTTDVGDAAYIVGNTGWVVPAKNSDALAKGLVSALQAMGNEKEWMQRKLDTRKRVQDHFTIEKMVFRYGLLWEKAIKNI